MSSKTTAKQIAGKHTIGWIGTGRMGYAMAERLLRAGCDVSLYNRTRAKAEPLADLGGRMVDAPAQLADRDIVFTMVAGPEDFQAVTMGPTGLLSNGGAAPKLLIDCTTVSEEASSTVRAAARRAGVSMLAAPVSGNAKVVKAGKLGFVVSGPREAFDMALPYLNAIGAGANYVGEGERSRIVKICHNIFLGVVIQSLAEITVLAEKAGVSRHAFLEFINNSVVGSTFSRYKTPALVNLDFKPTFTPILLPQALDLGLQAARQLEVPIPVTPLVGENLPTLLVPGNPTSHFATP